MAFGLRTLDGQWLRTFDPDAHAPGVLFPTGDAQFTPHVEEAKRFDSKVDAIIFWQQKSKVSPLRPDGQANRPLTAFTMSVDPLPEETKQ